MANKPKAPRKPPAKKPGIPGWTPQMKGFGVMAKKGSHMMPDGKMMKNSAMKGKKR